MLSKFDCLQLDCKGRESKSCFDCPVFLEWEESMRNVREIKWFDPKEVLPSDHNSCVLAIVSGGKNGIHFRRAYELVVYSSDGEWYSDAYPEMEKLEVHWWCELPDAPEETIGRIPDQRFYRN